MNKTWKAVLGVVLIYIFGCFSGAVSTSIFFHNRMLDFLQHPALAQTAEREKFLTGNLGLDANQKKQVHEFFMENLQHRKELQKEAQPRGQMLNRQTMQQIAAILHPDQAELFHQNIEKFRRHLAANVSNQDTENSSEPQAQASDPVTRSGAGQPPSVQ